MKERPLSSSTASAPVPAPLLDRAGLHHPLFADSAHVGRVALLEWVTSPPPQNLPLFSRPENAHRVKSSATASKEAFLDSAPSAVHCILTVVTRYPARNGVRSGGEFVFEGAVGVLKTRWYEQPLAMATGR